jgi:hypothetical protein
MLNNLLKEYYHVAYNVALSDAGDAGGAACRLLVARIVLCLLCDPEDSVVFENVNELLNTTQNLQCPQDHIEKMVHCRPKLTVHAYTLTVAHKELFTWACITVNSL